MPLSFDRNHKVELMRQITKSFFPLGQRQNNLNLSSKNKLSYSFNILFKIFQLNNTKIVVATLKVHRGPGIEYVWHQNNDYVGLCTC